MEQEESREGLEWLDGFSFDVWLVVEGQKVVTTELSENAANWFAGKYKDRDCPVVRQRARLCGVYTSQDQKR